MALVKPHLVLVHSFPTNSVLLHGLEEFLADFFTVHFIDLPGFSSAAPAFKGSITIKRFSDYLDKRISQLNISSYIVGGVSFGFLVVNNAKLDKRCKAIIAMEPYINADCLNLTFAKRIKYAIFARALKSLHVLGVEDHVWRSKWFKKYLAKGFDYPIDRVATIIDLIDARTFFTVAGILMRYGKAPRFHRLPYFLIGNFMDKTIDFDKVVEVFLKSLSELHIASEPIDHYPKELTKSYFSTRIPREHIERMLACIDGGK